MDLKTVIHTKNGKFAQFIDWSKHYSIDLSKLHALLNVFDWCESCFDNEANAGGMSYVKVKVKSVPENHFSVLLHPNFSLKFNVYSTGTLIVWEKNCGKNLPIWFDEFFNRFVFFCLMEK